MYRPKYVNVLGSRIEVEYTDLTKDECYGDADPRGKKIRIHHTLEGAELRRILRHEKMHIAIGLAGLSEWLTDEQEEAICTLVENVKL